MNEIDKMTNGGYNTHIYSSTATAEHILSHHGIRGQKYLRLDDKIDNLDWEKLKEFVDVH